MIKKREDWTFTECQTHAKGLLEGMVLGGLLTGSILTWLFWLYKYSNV